MDFDDSFTEGLVQRVRARKEYLNKKKTGCVKRAVLIDENQVNSDEPPNKSPKYQSAQATYSPHKQNAERQDEDSHHLFVPVNSASETRGLAALRNCYGNEQPNTARWPSDNKENTDMQTEDSSSLFVTGLSESRTKGLAALKKSSFESEEKDSSLHATSEFQVNKSNKYVFSTNSKDLCSGTKSRLAAFASNIRQWEDETHKPTLTSKNGALSYSAAGNSLAQTNPSSAKLSNFGKNSYNNPHPSSLQSKGDVGTLSSCKQGNINVVSVGGGHKKPQVWNEAIMATLENPISSTNLAKNVNRTPDSQNIPKGNQECNEEHIKENNYSENASNTKFDQHNNFKMELSSLPPKEVKENLKLPEKKKIVEAKMPASSVTVDSTVDPAELPLSARKALFENALMNGTPAINKDITNHKLSVAERAAMFENASKGNFRPMKSNFDISKGISRTDVSKFDRINHTSPVKTVQPVVKASPIKGLVSSPLPSKHDGNHVAFIQQKLNQKYDTQEKEVESKVPEVPKPEISHLVNQWEKLSSSSEKSSLNEERKDFAFKEPISYDSDVNEEISEHESEHNSSGEEIENVVFEDEQNGNSDCSEEDSDMCDVYNQPDTEMVSSKSVEDGRGRHVERQSSSASSQNTESVTGSRSPSYSEISSYTDNSSHYASGSQSCSLSGSSVRSYEVSSEISDDSKKENKPEVPLLYTVSFYRKQKQETRLTPVRTVVHSSEENSPPSPKTDRTEYIQGQIKALQEEILRQQTVISQTSQALNLCSCTAEFSGSMEQVEGERLLLIATQKRQACLNEITRMKAFGSQGENLEDGKGTLTITDLQLPLKREFIASQLEGKGNDTVHYFLCLIRHGAQVIVTQMMSTDDKTSDGALCFTNHIQLQNLPADFSVIFEVYALQTKKEVLSHEKKYHIKREHSKIRLTPKGKKGDGKILLPAISSPGGPNAVRSPSFGVVGYSRFTLLNCNKKTFTLDKVPFSSPLEGVLRVRLQLHAEHKVMEKGFLTMFEDVSGFGAWHRRWCALDTCHLSYWKYPDDEHKKEPVGVIDLKQCVTSEIKLAPRDVCARPHTLQLVTVRPQEKGDKNTLITRSMNTLTTTKHLLSADTKEERILWCNKLNEALTSVRKWDPRALKPINTK